MKSRKVRIIVCNIIVILLAAGVILIPRTYRKSKEQENSEQIQTYINDSLHYDKEDWEKEYQIMSRWLDDPYVSDIDKGLLYERLSNFYQFEGDTLGYYRCLGNALYYLKTAGRKDTAANIYADLTNYYVNNSSLKKAQDMLDGIYEMSAVPELDNVQVESYVYRMQALVYCRNGDYEEALAQLALSDACLEREPEGYYQEFYRAMNDAVYANIHFGMGNYQDAEQIITFYQDSELFDATIYRDFLIRDFIIPYYEAAVKLAAYNQDSAHGGHLIGTYCTYCEKNGYWKMELNTLLYLMKELPPSKEMEKELMLKKINEAYLIVTDMQTDEYSSLIGGQLMSAMDEQQAIRATKLELQQRNSQICVITVILIFLVGFVAFFFRQNHIDALTGVWNRRALNEYMGLCRLLKKPYCVIMIDIDDFKKINDTYGHLQGDIVLQRMGEILKSMKHEKTASFRYGGEEFVVMIHNDSMGKLLWVAEEIRRAVAGSEWDYEQKITISLGVADGKSNMDVIEEADQNLYFAKENGKNIVAYTMQGEKVLYQFSEK
ncbi:MAG: GGDEF domain-containing protein [Clostridia bacterium]|nr:GGDEF domain-containing protein [Clostridia bacterium]